MSHQRRLDVLSIAREYELLIVEDECYADLVWGLSRPAALHALDQDQRVIHIGSFSKSIAPALRVGYVAAHWNIMRYVLASKTDAGSGALEQMMLAEFCAAHFNEHVKQLNERLERKAHALCDALTYHFGDAAAYTRPKGGIFLWVKFPDLVDSLALQPAAADAGIAFNPGPDWSTNVAASRSAMRLCFANPSIEILQAGVATLADVIATQTGLQLANK